MIVETRWLRLVVLSCAAWALASWLSSANLDGYHDMLENHAWGQHWALGTHKHPPFFAWVAAAWFAVFPEGDLAYRVLAFVNVGIGIAGVVALARAWARLTHAPLPEAAIVWSALLLLAALPYTTLAGKFNANTQLLSLWPWVAALMLQSWQSAGVRGWAASVALGLVAAAAMLSKYFSGVFLAGLLAPIFAHAAGRAWLKTPRPYVALAVFAAALAPHLRWLQANDWATLAYVGEQATTSGQSSLDWRHIASFAVSPLIYWLPAWLAGAALYGWQVAWLSQSYSEIAQNAPNPSNPECKKGHFSTRLWLRATLRMLARSWRPAGSDDVVFWLAAAPWALTLAFGLSGFVELSTPWAIPIGYAFALLWLRNWHAAAPEATLAVVQRLTRIWPRALVAVVLLGGVAAGVNAQKGHTNFYRPSAQAAQTIVQSWQARHSSGQSIGWVSGAWAESAIVGFYAEHRVRTVPDAPDTRAAAVLGFREQDWRGKHGVFICPLGRLGDDAALHEYATAAHGATFAAEQLPASVAADGCVAQTLAWLAAHHQERGASQRVHVHVVRRAGWPFVRPVFFAYAVLDYEP